MSEADGTRDQIGEDGHAGVRLKELRVVRKKRGIESFQDRGGVDLGVFDGGMIALHCDGCETETGEQCIVFGRGPWNLQVSTFRHDALPKAFGTRRAVSCEQRMRLILL